MKLATLNLAGSWSLHGPLLNPTRRKSGCGPGLEKLLKIWRLPFNISATAEASDFKSSTSFGFAKIHHKITHIGISGRGRGLGELSKIWSFPFNIYTMAEASDFKFGIQLGFAKARHKITPISKGGCDLGLESSQYFEVPL